MIAKYLKRLHSSAAIAALTIALAYLAFAQTAGSGPVLSSGASVNVGQPSSTQLSRDEINQQEQHDNLEENTHHDGIEQGLNSQGRADDISHELRLKQLEAAQTPYKPQHIADENEQYADEKKANAQQQAIEAQRHAQALARIAAAAQALLSGAASALGNAANGGGGSPSGSAPQPNSGGSASNPSGGGSAGNPNSGGSASNPSSGGGSPGNRAYPGGAPGGVPSNPALGGNGAPAGNPNSGGSTASNPNGGGSSSNPNGGGGPSNNPNAGGGSPSSPRLAGGASNSNAGNSSSNPNTGNGSPNNPYSGGASASNPNSGGGSPSNPNAGGGSPSNPRLTGNASSSPNSGGNSPSNPSAGNGSPNNPYSGSASASSPNNGGGSPSNPNAGSGSSNSPQLVGNASSNANASSAPGNATPGQGLLHPLVAMADWWAKMTQPPSSQGTGKPYTGPLAVNGRSLGGIINDSINKVVDAIPGAAGALQRINQAVGGYAKSQQNEWTQQQTPVHQVTQVAGAALFNSAFQAAGGGAGALKQQLQQSLSKGAGVTGAMAAVVAKNGRDNIGKAMLNGAVSDARAIFGPTANKLFPRTGLASGGNGEPVVSNGSGGSNPPYKTGVTETGDPGANMGGEPNGQGGAPSNGTNEGKTGSSGPKPAEYPAARPPTLRGMTAKTDQTLQQIAKKKGWSIFTRDSNPGAARFIGQPGYVPKPQYIKLKSTPYDPSLPLYEQPNAGLVTTKGAPPAEVEALEAQGYQADGDGILSKDGNRFYSDVDLHGVYDAAGNDAFPQFLQELTKPEYNDDSYLQWLVQHSSHDGWPGRNDLKIAGSNVGPQAGNGKSVTAYTPNSQASLDSIAELRRFYLEQNIDFDRLYPGNR